MRLPGTQLCTAVAVATTKPGSFLGNAEALGALWCSNYGRLVVFQSGAPKAFGVYKMLLRSTNLNYGDFVGTDLQKTAGLSSKRAGFEDGLPKSAGLSSKRGLNEDELPKNAGLSSKRAVFEDELPKSAGLSSKRGVFEDGLRKNTGLSSKRAVFEDGLPKSAGLSSKRGVFEDGLPIMAQKVVR